MSNLSDMRETYADPPREFGLMPFWAWNDDLDDEELLRQVREMHAAGFGGFVPHADLGLSRRIGYLTEEYFRLLRLAVDEAARLGMKVILYDEGYYPSGSAQGRVAAEDATYAARCLIPVELEIQGPARGFWRPNPGRAVCDTLVCAVLARVMPSHGLDPESLRLLEPDEHEVVGYDVGPGRWRIVSCWHVYSGGTIRGVFAEEDDGHALAPAAADIMNPAAVTAFIRLTHEAYYTHLRDHFGATIVAMFTDEPSAVGRSPKRGPRPQPFTEGFLSDLQRHWDDDVRTWLPALWHDRGPRTMTFRRAYAGAVQERLESAFYGPLGEWCGGHGIALTGHPSMSDEMTGLRRFQWPGQDMVWRYVEPAKPTALEGHHSVAPKVASSVAAILGRRRNLSELIGAYGWHTTLGEIKWLLDWHLVRGTNLFVPGSCMYSLRGRRAYNSEPDIGYNNVWWPHFTMIAGYVRRMCWLLSDGVEVCRVAILTDGTSVAWRAARQLYRSQIDFVYLDDQALRAASARQGLLEAGATRLGAVVCDPPLLEDAPLPPGLEAFARDGGLVLRDGTSPDLVSRLVGALGRDLEWPAAPDVRCLHYRKAGLELYFLVNEGEEAVEGDLTLAEVGALELWDPLSGSARPWPAAVADRRLRTHLRLERRQGLLLVVDPRGTHDPHAVTPPQPGDALSAMDGPWVVTNGAGGAVDMATPGDWAQVRGWELYTGTLSYRTEFELDDGGALAGALFLDLGRVGDIAEVFVNGRSAGTRAWAPYVAEIGGACHHGVNRLQVNVTNSMANAYDGRQMPSGLMGPVVLRGPRGA